MPQAQSFCEHKDEDKEMYGLNSIILRLEKHETLKTMSSKIIECTFSDDLVITTGKAEDLYNNLQICFSINTQLQTE